MDNNNQLSEAEIAARISVDALEQRREQIKPSWSMGLDDSHLEQESPAGNC
jgi:hypothetical protein